MNAKMNGSNVLQRIGRALVSVGLAGLLAACGGGSDAPPPAPAPPAAAITAQPTDQSAVAGTSATFSVTASSATGYQWQRSRDGGASFADVAGATATSHTTTATTPADNATQFRVVVAGSGGSVTSSAALLTVTAAVVAPSISVQPAAQTITAGQNASFSVTASGTAMTYQWQHSMDGGTTFSDEAGATAATLMLTAVAQVHNGHFLRVVVSNSLGSVTSTPALLTVNAATAAAAITQHPTSQSVTVPAAATFSAAASGIPAPTLQWQVNAGPGWDDIVGATLPSYTTPATAVSDNGKRYRVMASNVTAAGTALVTSNAATLAVSAAASAPAFTTRPASVTITAGQSTQFTVAASGSPTPAIQWQLSTDNGANWSNIVGATGPVFNVLNAAQANNGRQFRAVASNTAGTLNSNAAVLTVNAVQGIKVFGTPARVETGATLAARPQIAIALNGDAVAVWMQQSDGQFFNIWAARYTSATNTWGSSELIENGEGDAWDPQIAVDTTGNALVVWQQDVNTTAAVRRDIWSNRYAAGTGWGTAVLVETEVGYAKSPHLAMDSSGNALAVWVQTEGQATHIRANRFTSGSWGIATLIEAATAGASADPKVAIDASGSALAVWSRYDGTNNLAMANRYNSGAGWGTAETIGADTPFVGISQAQVAIDRNGNASAVWVQGSDIWANGYITGTGWGTAARIEFSGGDASAPQIAFDTSGNALAVWQQNSGFGTPTRIWSNRYTVGSGWGGFPATIQTDSVGGTTAYAAAPQIAIDANGNAIAVWGQPDNLNDTTYDIWVNRYTTSNGWGTTSNLGQIRINTPSDIWGAGSPRIAFDSQGNAIAVWIQHDGGAETVWASVYR